MDNDELFIAVVLVIGLVAGIGIADLANFDFANKQTIDVEPFYYEFQEDTKDKNVIGQLTLKETTRTNSVVLSECSLVTYGFESKEIGEEYFKQNDFSNWKYLSKENRGIHLFWASSCIQVPEEFKEFGDKFLQEKVK